MSVGNGTKYWTENQLNPLLKFINKKHLKRDLSKNTKKKSEVRWLVVCRYCFQFEFDTFNHLNINGTSATKLGWSNRLRRQDLQCNQLRQNCVLLLKVEHFVFANIFCRKALFYVKDFLTFWRHLRCAAGFCHLATLCLPSRSSPTPRPEQRSSPAEQTKLNTTD